MLNGKMCVTFEYFVGAHRLWYKLVEITFAWFLLLFILLLLLSFNAARAFLMPFFDVHNHEFVPFEMHTKVNTTNIKRNTSHTPLFFLSFGHNKRNRFASNWWHSMAAKAKHSLSFYCIAWHGIAALHPPKKNQIINIRSGKEIDHSKKYV